MTHERAKRALRGSHTFTDSRAGIAVAIGVAARRIGWPLLDLADAVRESTEQRREATLDLTVTIEAAAADIAKNAGNLTRVKRRRR